MSTIRIETQPFDAHRPNTFSQIVGNQSVVRRVTNMLAKNLLPKVLFLTGPTGAGKTTIARIIARAKLCTGRPLGEFEPCGSCELCCMTLNDSTCGVYEYQEYGAIDLTDEMIVDFKFDFLRDWKVFFIDELQDLKKHQFRLLRKKSEGVIATLIFTTSHPDEIEDAFRNRLKSYEYEMTRPTPDEVADFLEERFKQLKIDYESRSQMIRVAESLNCEMRPCGEFPRNVLAETEGTMTDEYLDDLFGIEASQATSKRDRRRREI